MDDEKILELFWARNELALEMVQEKYGLRLYKLACSILRDPQDAEEVGSDTMLAAWNSIPPARPDKLGAFLAVICRNRAFTLLEKKKAAKRSARVVELSAELEEVLPAGYVEDAFFGRELERVLNRFLEELEPENRILFVRRYFYCESEKEIARLCGEKVSWVKGRLFRIRKRLARFLEAAGV